MFYHVLNTKAVRKFSVVSPLVLVYAGKKKVCELAIRNNFEAMLETAILKWAKFHQA